MTSQQIDDFDNMITVEPRGSLAIIRLNHPRHRNSLSIRTLEVLDKTVSSLMVRRGTTSLIFTGVEDVFASGAEINELAMLEQDSARAFAKFGQGVFDKIASASQTTIAAINGFCFGGGLDFALACDLRCASKRMADGVSP